MGPAGEGNQALETPVGTAYPCEAPGEDAAVQVGAKLSFDEGGEAVAVGAPFTGRGEERLQPLPDDLVHEGPLGFPPVVPTERRARGARLALPESREARERPHPDASQAPCPPPANAAGSGFNLDDEGR